MSTNPYIDDHLRRSQQEYSPQTNEQFEHQYNVVKKSRKRYKLISTIVEKKTDPHTDTPSKNTQFKSTHTSTICKKATTKYVWYHPQSNSFQETTESTQDRILPGNKDNTEKLITKYIRDQEYELHLSIPDCINAICFHCFYEPTNIIFSDYDPRVSHYVSISKKGKMVNILSRTIFLFSCDGYDYGYHIWHIKCHRVHTCQALGICEYKNNTYRYGDNIFDISLNEQLGDRYIYAGDSGHSWRGSNELRPYVCSMINGKEYYSKKLKLINSKWNVGDIITVEIQLGTKRDTYDDSKRRIVFYKNGKALCEPITIVKKCMYYPVFQVYQRGKFEVIDDITKQVVYKP
eukprot:168317_1